jgi:acetyltransferase-like isoleucine patch superfamily enzyme
MQLSRLSALYLRVRYRRLAFGPGLSAPFRLRVRGPGRVLVGRDVRIRNRSGRTAILTFNRDARIEIGDGVEIDGAGIMAASRIVIGADASLGPCLLVDTDFHAVPPARRQMGEEGARRPIQVGEQAVIEAKATVLKGVSIGKGAVVRWGSVVASDVPAFATVLGNPAALVPDDEVRR